MSKSIRTRAIEDLGLTVADLKADPTALRRIKARMEEIAGETKRETDRVTQADVLAALEAFPGYAENPDVYGPTVADVTRELRADGRNVKSGAVSQHLSKLRKAGVIYGVRKLESEGRGAPPLAFYKNGAFGFTAEPTDED